jgi:hypothetical protein
MRADMPGEDDLPRAEPGKISEHSPGNPDIKQIAP